MKKQELLFLILLTTMLGCQSEEGLNDLTGSNKINLLSCEPFTSCALYFTDITSGDTIASGDQVKIWWDFILGLCETPNEIDIFLYKGSQKISTIESNVSFFQDLDDEYYAGHYFWTVDDCLLGLGSNYNIQISPSCIPSMQHSITGNFVLSGTWAPESVAPNGGEKIKLYTNYSIHWDSDLISGTNVKIELYKGGLYNSTLQASTLNNGHRSQFSSQPIGSDYKVRITNLSNSSNFIESANYFSMDTSPAFSTGLLSPNFGSVTDDYPVITWNTSSFSDSHVRIEYFKDGVLFKTIISETANDGSAQFYNNPSVLGSMTGGHIKISSFNDCEEFDLSDNWVNIYK